MNSGNFLSNKLPLLAA